MSIQGILRQQGDGGGSGGGSGDAGSGGQDAAYYQAEAKKAFLARDAAKQALRDLQDSGRVVSDEQMTKYRALEEAATAADEERKKKAGEFESLRVQLTTKHESEIKAREERIAALGVRFKDTVIKAEFGAASSYFGGDSAKTILDVDLGMAALGKYVRVEDDEQDPRGYRVVVVSPSGQPILGRDGNPATFADAIGELIAQLPNKDRILRGSGKTGSGSSGGSGTTAADLDVDALIARAAAGDQDAIKKLKARQSTLGGMQMGSSYQRAG